MQDELFSVIALQCKERYGCVHVVIMLPQQHAVQVQRPYCILVCLCES